MTKAESRCHGQYGGTSTRQRPLSLVTMAEEAVAATCRSRLTAGDPDPTEIQVAVRCAESAASTMMGTTTQSSDPVQCNICLSTRSEGAAPQPLRCSHAFCQPCLQRHVEVVRSAGNEAWCPTCRRSIEAEDLRSFGLPAAGSAEIPAPPEAGASHGRRASSARWPWQLSAQRRAERAFRLAARKAHLKYCPGCSSMIEKHEGCDHMTCRCGCDFSWKEARPVVPCNKVHFGCDDEGIMRFWGHTCPGCSRAARVKLATMRTAEFVVVAPVAASAAAVGVGVAAVAMVVPAVVLAPAAIAYEPVRRFKGKQVNPFARGMASGAMAVGLGLYYCVLAENDESHAGA